MFENLLSRLGQKIDSGIAWIGKQVDSVMAQAIDLGASYNEKLFDHTHPCRQRLATKVAYTARGHVQEGGEPWANLDQAMKDKLHSLTAMLVEDSQITQEDIDKKWHAISGEEHSDYDVEVAKAVLFSSCPRKKQP